MVKRILIVEDQFVEANDLKLIVEKAGYIVCGIARSVIQAREIIEKEKPDMVLLDIFLKGLLTGIDLAKELKINSIPFVYLSANSDAVVFDAAKLTEPQGFLVKPFREKDVLVTIDIAWYRHINSVGYRNKNEAALKQKLENINAEHIDWEQKLLKMTGVFQKDIPFDFLVTSFKGVQFFTKGKAFLRIGFNEYQTIGLPELQVITGLKKNKLTSLIPNSIPDDYGAIYSGNGFEQFCAKQSFTKLLADTFNLKSLLALPIHLSGGNIFSFYFYSRKENVFLPWHTFMAQLLQQIFAKAVEKEWMTPTTEMQAVPRQIFETDGGFAKPIKNDFAGIVGNSHLLLTIFDHLAQVAPTNTSVLILGESGTGKERVADCIHNLSTRKGKPFVKVNCAALPATLIETELFGHEKGSFTGASEKRIGKFEQANNGTIFLDEIGEMPLELQVKLLRVLQEREIEPIGSRNPVKINVRIIAATNRNLEKEVAEGRFRLDLYYRLNIFPIILPPIRDRKEDIPVLVAHFIDYFNQRTGKKITGAAEKVMKKLMAYNWPGNVRELEHLIERAVLLSKGTVIEAMELTPTMIKNEDVSAAKEMPIKTMLENERDHILVVLKRSNGKIFGNGGAAELLGIPPTTLISKMKKLKIKKEHVVY